MVVNPVSFLSPRASMESFPKATRIQIGYIYFHAGTILLLLSQGTTQRTTAADPLRNARDFKKLAPRVCTFKKRESTFFKMMNWESIIVGGDETNGSKILNGTTVMEQNALRYTTGVSSILSIIGALFIIFSTILFKIVDCRKRRKPRSIHSNYYFHITAMNHRLVLYLSITDLFASISYAISLFGLSLEYDWCCQLQGFLMTWFELSSVFWSTCICLHLFLSVTPMFSEENQRKKKIILEIFFVFICWLIPMIYSIVILLTTKFNRMDNLQVSEMVH